MALACRHVLGQAGVYVSLAESLATPTSLAQLQQRLCHTETSVCDAVPQTPPVLRVHSETPSVEQQQQPQTDDKDVEEAVTHFMHRTATLDNGRQARVLQRDELNHIFNGREIPKTGGASKKKEAGKPSHNKKPSSRKARDDL